MTQGTICHSCTKSFTVSWPDSRNMSITITFTNGSYGLELLFGTLTFPNVMIWRSGSKTVAMFPEGKALPILMAANVVFFGTLYLFSLSRILGDCDFFNSIFSF